MFLLQMKILNLRMVTPIPFYGEILTAEQLFQQQVAIWLQQNGLHANHPANNVPLRQINQLAEVVPVPEPAPVVDQILLDLPDLNVPVVDPPLFNF